MTAVRRADPVERRLVVLLVIFGVLVATLLIDGFERYATQLAFIRAWGTRVSRKRRQKPEESSE
jgi:hypothetical protein